MKGNFVRGVLTELTLPQLTGIGWPSASTEDCSETTLKDQSVCKDITLDCFFAQTFGTPY